MERAAPEYHFPEMYYESYLVLLVRDPHCIYAYWEISPDVRGLVTQRDKGGGVPSLMRLRVYDSTGLEHNSPSSQILFDTVLPPMTDNYFIKEVDANRSYYAELGAVTEDGGFLTLLRSNLVRTPRNGMADITESNTEQISAGKEAFHFKNVSAGELLIGSFAHLGTYGDSTG